MRLSLDTIESAVDDIRAGKIVIVVDDEDRENEGDFVCAARAATPEVINFMATYGRGLICAPLLEDRCNELGLSMMVNNNSAAFETPFTVSIDLIGHGCTTGISAQDRSKTVLALIIPETRPEELGKPGHIFPLKAQREGVLKRAGHTEAAIDLARLAGLEPAGVIVEILNEDGTMARLPQLFVIAEKFNLKIISIKDLIAFRIANESLIQKQETISLPTEFGDFKLVAYKQTTTDQDHLALFKGEWSADEAVLVRVHSSCITGDIFGSCRCDCGPQLHEAMKMIEKEGKGVVVYMNQEGRGIGLINKIRAYALQENGADTVEANHQLGFADDIRNYAMCEPMLAHFGISALKLMTNNPRKMDSMKRLEIQAERVEHVAASTQFNAKYLATKANKLGHLLTSTPTHSAPKDDQTP
jgi:3,4-dihydroxy 2-butanone 4-phosphate synthase/GTP cyclohydrolase II